MQKRGCPKSNECSARRNDCYTKCGGFDKLNHRNANLLDSLFFPTCKIRTCCQKFFYSCTLQDLHSDTFHRKLSHHHYDE